MDIKEVISIAKKAGEKILEIYNSDFDVEMKESSTFDEGVSPLTSADGAAHLVIEEGLKKFELPILSEESKAIPYFTRKEWSKFFLVDPLDGTKEFIKKNGEFTVNIALISDGKPVLGVVYVPVSGICYYADENGSYKEEDGIVIRLPVDEKRDKMLVVASRSHFSEETEKYIESLGKDYELVNAGSSLKLCLVAEGKADIYPRLGPTMEWDTAAAHAVVNFAGKKVIKYDNEDELEYNKENLLNPWFIVR